MIVLRCNYQIALRDGVFGIRYWVLGDEQRELENLFAITREVEKSKVHKVTRRSRYLFTFHF